MPRGFFPESRIAAMKAPAARMAQCGACGLHKHCQSPKMPPSGKGKRKVMILDEAPGKPEDEAGVHLCGKDGQELEAMLESIGVNMRRDCYVHSAIICSPDRAPTPEEVGYCRPNVSKAIKELNPEIIIPLGAVAMSSLLGAVPTWSGDVGSITRWAGYQIPNQNPNVWICPTYHPSYLLRNRTNRKGNRMRNDDVVDRIIKQNLDRAFQLTELGRPAVTNWQDQVQIIHKPGEAARAIRSIRKRKSGSAAFDYETNMLKPDPEDARIVTCSICWGEYGNGPGPETIAYPWHGEAIEETGKFLRSPLPKIASNMKFEERWTMKMFGHRVRNWAWDTMLAAHWLDNRDGVTSIKFQAFVLLGAPIYDEHIKPFLKTKGDARVNKILKEIDLDDLLLYNGLDSLLEWHVANRQEHPEW